MAEALANVKRHFGPDAVILSTRTVSKGGLLGLAGKSLVEITAAREAPALAQTDRTRRLAGSQIRKTPKTSSAAGVGVAAMVACSASSDHGSTTRMFKEFDSLKSLVSDLMRETRRTNLTHAPPPLFDSYRHLIENAVAEEVAMALIKRLEQEIMPDQLKEPATIRQGLSKIIMESLPTAGPIVPKAGAAPYIAALIGPTGVGKTTTVAKLAANFSLREGKKVGLITLDTYRIAAVEQLKTYAQIIDVPMKVAMSPEEYQDAVFAMKDMDVILVDSAGRSQRDALKIQELHGFFAAVAPHETHLVLSSASNDRVIYQAIDRFSQIGFDRVIFTKMDEAVGFGVILGALQKVNARISYITTGQDVPADIEVGESDVLANMILGPSGPPLNSPD